MHDGIQRNYTIYVPSSYTAHNSVPLVVNMHGYTLNRSFQMQASGMNAVAEREGFLVVYPEPTSALLLTVGLVLGLARVRIGCPSGWGTTVDNLLAA